MIETETINPPVCPACKIGQGLDPRVGKDRYGNECYTLHCPHCGLGMWRDRPTRQWYADFYRSGEYRKLVSQYHGRDVMATITVDQSYYAERLMEHVKCKPGTCLLDIGGSTGIIANAFAKKYDCTATVLDPAAELTVDGRSVKHIQTGAEEYKNSQRFRWDTILMCQTIDHLTDPFAVLAKVRKWLNRGGQFFVDILDTAQEQDDKGWSGTLKVDHPFAWTHRSICESLYGAKLRVVKFWKSAGNHMGYLCE